MEANEVHQTLGICNQYMLFKFLTLLFSKNRDTRVFFIHNFLPGFYIEVLTFFKGIIDQFSLQLKLAYLCASGWSLNKKGS